MSDNYQKIVAQNLEKLYADLRPDLDRDLGANRDGDRFTLTAFGDRCTISPDGVTFEKRGQDSILGILISLYALNAGDRPLAVTPLKAFKEFPDSMPYAGAFTTHTEQLLVPHVAGIKSSVPAIVKCLDGKASPEGVGGDFSFLLFPLPKVALCYIFYEADDDFPAGVTCLYSHNARQFLPVDGLADLGEYTSRTILDCL